MQLCLEICKKKSLSQSLLEILNTQSYGEIASQLNIRQVTEQTDRDGGKDGRGTVTDYTGYWRACGGRGKHVFVFQFQPHLGFSIRWQMTHFTPCTLQISRSTTLTSSPYLYSHLFIWLLLHPNFTSCPPAAARHVHTLSSFCSTEALARYVNKVNRIVAGGMQQNLYKVLS